MVVTNECNAVFSCCQESGGASGGGGRLGRLVIHNLAFDRSHTILKILLLPSRLAEKCRRKTELRTTRAERPKIHPRSSRSIASEQDDEKAIISCSQQHTMARRALVALCTYRTLIIKHRQLGSTLGQLLERTPTPVVFSLRSHVEAISRERGDCLQPRQGHRAHQHGNRLSRSHARSIVQPRSDRS